MPNRLSLMLDSMILAVDEGHSYDGVASVPETGLEDVTYRLGLVGLLADRLELVQEAILRVPVISRFLAKRNLPTGPRPETPKRTSVADSKIGHGETKPRLTSTPPIAPEAPPSQDPINTERSPDPGDTLSRELIRPERRGSRDPRKRNREDISTVGRGVGHVSEQDLTPENEPTGTGQPRIRNMEEGDKVRQPRRRM